MQKTKFLHLFHCSEQDDSIIEKLKEHSLAIQMTKVAELLVE